MSFKRDFDASMQEKMAAFTLEEALKVPSIEEAIREINEDIGCEIVHNTNSDESVYQACRHLPRLKEAVTLHFTPVIMAELEQEKICQRLQSGN